MAVLGTAKIKCGLFFTVKTFEGNSAGCRKEQFFLFNDDL